MRKGSVEEILASECPAFGLEIGSIFALAPVTPSPRSLAHPPHPSTPRRSSLSLPTCLSSRRRRKVGRRSRPTSSFLALLPRQIRPPHRLSLPRAAPCPVFLRSHLIFFLQLQGRIGSSGGRRFSLRSLQLGGEVRIDLLGRSTVDALC